MVTPKECVDAIARALGTADELPPELSVLIQEADIDQDDADVDLPLLEMQIIDADFTEVHNTDRVGFLTDDEGNKVGKVFDSEYELTVQLSLWVTHKDEYDVDKLGADLRRALYPYSSYGPDQQFWDEMGAPIERISHFELGVGERADEFIQTPTVRKWDQLVELSAAETFRTNEDYIVNVDSPESDELTDNGEGAING
jgi:hypothetical protein